MSADAFPAPEMPVTMTSSLSGFFPDAAGLPSRSFNEICGGWFEGPMRSSYTELARIREARLRLIWPIVTVFADRGTRHRNERARTGVRARASVSIQ